MMMHGDDDGAVLPPRVAPTQIVILPVTPKAERAPRCTRQRSKLAARLCANNHSTARGCPCRSRTRDLPGGTKNWEWIKKGAPLRIEIGPRDIEKGTVAVARRDHSPKEKSFPTVDEFVSQAPQILQSIQDGLFKRADDFRRQHSVRIDSEADFRAFFTPENPDKPEIHGGFALCHWAGDNHDENRLREELKVTIRCLPRGEEFAESGTCFLTGRPSSRRVVFAKSY